MACSSLVKVATSSDPKEVFYKNENGAAAFFGLEGKMLEVIIQGLNAPFELVRAEDKDWGRLLPDGNWTGVVGKLQKEIADIAIHLLFVTEERLSVVDYSPTYTTESATFAIGKPGFRPKSMAFVEAFDSKIWITTLVFLLLMPLIFTILLREKGGYTKFIFLLASYILQKSANHKQDRFQYRILLSSWSIFTTILSLSYLAVFFSLLTLPAEMKGVQNFQELSEAVVKNGYKCYALKGKNLDLLVHSEKKYLRELGQNIVLNEWYLKGFPLLPGTIMDKQTAMIAGRPWLSVEAGPEDWKHFYVSDDTLMTFQLAVAMRKGFCHKRRLNNVIHRMNNGGLYEQIRYREIFKLWNYASERRRIAASSVKSLSLNDLRGAFLLLGAGLGLSTFSFLTELLFMRRPDVRKF